MRRVVFLTLIFASTSAYAADIDIDVHNFTVDGGIAKAVMLVKNNLSKQVENIFIDCAFLNKDKRAVGIGTAHIQSIPAGGDAYDDASLATNVDVEFVDCRVDTYDR